MKMLRVATLLSLMTFAAACHAQMAGQMAGQRAVQPPAQVTVSQPWVRGTVAAQHVTGGFMQLTSKTDATVVEVTSPVAGRVEMHEMRTGGDGMMTMRGIESLALPAGKTVTLQPGGYHLMLMDLKQPLKAGDHVQLTLVIEVKDKQRSTLTVSAPVRPLGATPPTPAPMPADHKH